MHPLKYTLEAEKAAAIIALIADANAQDDDVLVNDMIEAETELFDILEMLVRQMNDEAYMVEAIKQNIACLQERKQRYEKRSDSIRQLIFEVMQKAGLRKATLPAATLSIMNGRAKTIITDETMLPPRFLKTEVKPLLKEISDAIKGGEDVPGAMLSNGSETISIRAK